MKIRHFILLLIALLCASQAEAVLKEKDLGETLRILRAELQHTHSQLGTQQKMLTDQSEQLRQQLISTMRRSNQNALMLYSQKAEYVFDLTYACHEATEQYREFKNTVTPFRMQVESNESEVARYDSLIQALMTMPQITLDDRARIDRNVCLALAVNIRRMVVENAQSLHNYMRFYEFSENRLKNLNDYAHARYNDIQNSIFSNGGDNYVSILMSIPKNMEKMQHTLNDKYVSENHIHSQWDSRVILILFVTILFYGIVAIAINQLLIRLLVTRLVKKGKLDSIKDTFMAKRRLIIMAATVITFALILCILRLTMQQNFIIMASGLLVEYSWLLSVILVSVLIRVKAEQTIPTVHIYSPLVFMGFIVITFRIVLIPNILTNLILPPALLLCMLWQFNVIKRFKQRVERSDRYYAYASLFVCITSVVCSMSGYTLLAVQVLIWWIMQLTCVLTITCMNDWYKSYAEHHSLSERPITETWFYDLFTRVITPAAGVVSFMLSVYWAAKVFNLNDMVWRSFTYEIIDSDNFRISLISVAQVVILWFVFRYINSSARDLVRFQMSRHSAENVESRSAMIINVLQVFVWGVWFIIALAILHVSNTWLVVISGGLSTGIGFASKDILENIYYGISLMAGRIKIGDLIVCDGTRGRVSSISYTSTMIEALDGSIIAFQNSQLFTKNYKNLTRNHGYEMQALEVGVAYGTNIQEVRQILIDAIQKLDFIQESGKDVLVLFKGFGDSSVDLKVVVWFDANAAGLHNSIVMECIYDTLNAHNIEIPFPQRDINFRNAIPE